ncbi:FTR1 family protein [Halobacillus litoralis]|uniref:FTR1 family iron permease n=1 Tax=Halobacillus litoralis TaxID=45668 RepID=UPI00273FC0B8|nr:FTR1 family protein [Halobacillus litoralis]WLR47230.1 FTR1 family protein [Halobacillus litoralis]
MYARHLTKIAWVTFVFLIVGSAFLHPVQAAEGKEELLPTVGNALVEVRSEDYDALRQSLETYQDIWEETEKASESKKTTATITEELEGSMEMLESSSMDQDQLYDQIVSLARATDDFVSSSSKQEAQVDRQGLQNLIAELDVLDTAIVEGEYKKAQELNRAFVTSWTALEKPIRETSVKAYGNIETKMAMVRVSLNKDPVDGKQASEAVAQLKQAIHDYLDGKTTGETVAQEDVTMAGLIGLLEQAQKNIDQNQMSEAAGNMEQFIQSWPIVEGKVLTKSQKVYNETEVTMTNVLSELSSAQPDAGKSNQMIEKLKADLEPFAGESSYSAWDAFFILLREGLEAILIIATLLAYLRRTDNENQRIWVWSGFGSGLIVSGGMAVLLTMVFAGLEAGANREIIEGVTGLVAVVMMLFVGGWLHKQSNILARNQFIHRKLNQAMNKRAKWMLALITFIAVFREGAETIIFYLGLAPSISLSQLLLGMGSALVLLLVLGVLLIKLSIKIPVRPFFMAASLLIYYIAFKFTGVSLHALQITNIIPVHRIEGMSNVDALGIYPTWETVAAQSFLLAVMAVQYFLANRKKRQLKQMPAEEQTRTVS